MTRTKQRAPQPDDLLTGSDIADLYGWPIDRAEALLRSIARKDGKWVEFEGFRRLFVRRADLEARMRTGPGLQS